MLMQKMKSISQQHSQMTEDDRSPEELQKVFEKVEITIPPSTPPSDTACHRQSGLLLNSSNVLKEKDPNLVTSCNSMNHPNHAPNQNHTPSPHLLSSPLPPSSSQSLSSSLHPNDPHYNCSLLSSQQQQQYNHSNLNSSNYYYHSNNSNSGNNYNNYSCSPSTGHHYLFGSRANSLSGGDSASLGIGSLSSPITSSCPSPSTCPFSNEGLGGNEENQMHPRPEATRFVIDTEFCYTDFARRGESSEFTTFRIQDYSWDDQGFSLVNQLYNDVGNLLDDKFKVTYNMTYYT